jgi:hypothetical protein
MGLWSTLTVLLVGILMFVQQSSKPRPKLVEANDGSSNAPPVVPIFRIERGAGTAPLVYSNLAAAVTAAITGDTIELPFTGDCLTTGLRIGKKSLRIRATPGSHPILNLAAGERAMFYAEDDLLLEGLELRAPGTGSDKVIPGDLPVTKLRGKPAAVRGESLDVLLFVDGGRLTLRSCRLVASPQPSTFNVLVVLENCPLAIFQDSEFYNLGGVAASWRRREVLGGRSAAFPGEAEVVFTNSLVVGCVSVGTLSNLGSWRTFALDSEFGALFETGAEF